MPRGAGGAVKSQTETKLYSKVFRVAALQRLLSTTSLSYSPPRYPILLSLAERRSLYIVSFERLDYHIDLSVFFMYWADKRVRTRLFYDGI
jgi:hypothetical protein